MEIFAFEVILNTCKSTENPPNPKTNEQITNLKLILRELSSQIKESPFVTSINPVSKLKLNSSGICKTLNT